MIQIARVFALCTLVSIGGAVVGVILMSAFAYVLEVTDTSRYMPYVWYVFPPWLWWIARGRAQFNISGTCPECGNAIEHDVD